MRVRTITTEGLGDRSYVIHDGSRALVIDPQRDIDRVLEVLDDEGVTIGLVAETHIHNDYVSGGLALARRTDAVYAVNAADEVGFDRRGVHIGQRLEFGELDVRVLASPGHTPTHLAYVVRHGGQTAVFTGGSMLYGTVGRTDLIGPAHTDRLSRAQYHSVRQLAEQLPADTAVYPTHGFGSFCSSAGGADRTDGTVADERRDNLACTTDSEEEFVQSLVAGFTAHPPYYAHMGMLNRAGPLPPDLTTPSSVSPDDLSRRIAAGEWVVDLRDRRSFAQGHLAGSVSLPVEDELATYLGWTIPWGTAVSLVADTESQLERAQRELVRIGIDRPQAIGVGGPEVFAKDQQVRAYPVGSFAELAEELAADRDVVVVDVRRDDEWADGHVDGAVHLPMERLAHDAADLPDDRTLWVHCASGMRAATAASLLARTGKRVVLIDDDVEQADELGLLG